MFMRFDSSKLGYAVVFLFALLIAHLRLHISVLDPSHTDWLWTHDWAQHFLGAHFLFHQGWSWPLGSIEGYLYPFGSSVANTDSIPILAILAKPFFFLSGESFQFLGVWFFLCIFLNGAVTYYFLTRQEHSKTWTLFAVLSMMTAGPLMQRAGHLSQMSQWLFLLMIFSYFEWRGRSFASFPYALIASVLLISVGVHPYIFASCLALSLAFYVAFFLFGQKSKRTKVCLFSAALGALLVLSLWAYGYLGISAPADGGFGFYSADLLSFLHPHNFPVLLPSWPHGEGQYEGYSYMGLGLVLMLSFAMILWARGPNKKALVALLPLFLVCFFLWVFALATPVTLAGRELLRLDWLYSLLEPLPSIFRASGRFVWLLYYFLAAAVFFYLPKRFSFRGWGMASLWILIIIQIVDMSRIVHQPSPPLKSLALNELSLLEETLVQQPHLKHLFVLESQDDRLCSMGSNHYDDSWLYAEFLYRAPELSMSINLGKAGRIDKAAVRENCLRSMAALKNGSSPSDTLYVIPSSTQASIGGDFFPVDRFLCREHPRYLLCWSKSFL